MIQRSFKSFKDDFIKGYISRVPYSHHFCIFLQNRWPSISFPVLVPSPPPLSFVLRSPPPPDMFIYNNASCANRRTLSLNTEQWSSERPGAALDPNDQRNNALSGQSREGSCVTHPLRNVYPAFYTFITSISPCRCALINSFSPSAWPRKETHPS